MDCIPMELLRAAEMKDARFVHRGIAEGDAGTAEHVQAGEGGVRTDSNTPVGIGIG